MAHLTFFIAVTGVLLFVSHAEANSLRWTRGVTTGVELVSERTSIDNVDNSNSERRATLSPFMSISSEGRRTSYNIQGSLLATLSSEPDDSVIEPRIAALSSISTASERFTFESSALLQQRAINSLSPEGDSILDRSSREQVVSLSFSPRYEQSFGRTFVAAAYNAGIAEASETDDSRSTVQAVAVELTHIMPDRRWVVGSRIDTQHSNFVIAPSAWANSVAMFSGYQLSRSLAGRISVGKERLNIGDGSDSVNSNLWGVGVNWRLARQVTLDASYLERSFGRQPNVTMNIQGRRSSVELSWTRSLGISSVAQNIQFGQLDGLNTNDVDDVQTTDTVDTIEPQEIAVDSTIPLFQESRSINETLQLTYSLRGRVSVLSTSISSIEQENLVSEESTQSGQLNVSLTRQLTRSSSVVASAAWVRTQQLDELDNDVSDGTISRFGIQWSTGF